MEIYAFVGVFHQQVTVRFVGGKHQQRRKYQQWRNILAFAESQTLYFHPSSVVSCGTLRPVGAQAKAKMQTVFQGAKANDIFNIIYSKMAVSLGLSPNATIARQQYNSLVTNLDDKIFGFVITN